MYVYVYVCMYVCIYIYVGFGGGVGGGVSVTSALARGGHLVMTEEEYQRQMTHITALHHAPSQRPQGILSMQPTAGFLVLYFSTTNLRFSCTLGPLIYVPFYATLGHYRAWRRGGG